MKEEAPLNVRSLLTRGARLAGGLCFLVLVVVAIVAGIEPAWAKWSVFLVSLSGLLVIMFWRVAPTDPGTEAGAIARLPIGVGSASSEAREHLHCDGSRHRGYPLRTTLCCAACANGRITIKSMLK